ncbi:MAG: DUF3576 domain-containing protein [Alphaproteobacteria bacterium]|nr:DUF3576 domain-containing protein [Alphaproteobacteria bacterium]
MKFSKLTCTTAILSVFVVFLTGCASGSLENAEYNYPEKGRKGMSKPSYSSDKKESIFGEGGMDLFGNKRSKSDHNGSGGGIGVNSFLWQATLDTVSFLPIASADAFGGVIITDWYSPPETPKERFKVNAFIIGKSLRADGIKITTFRQVKNKKGQWVDATIDPQISTDMENTVLTRARQLRMSTLGK